MNNILPILLALAVVTTSAPPYTTTGVVTIVGGVLKARSVEVVQKYKRKDCPVCKGTGYYISGDGIAKVNCGYCEVEKSVGLPPAIPNQNTGVVPKRNVVIQPRR